MAKYRLLTHEELMEMEQEFVEYLVVNGITAPDWEKMKKEEPAKAKQIIELFSDVVFAGILRKIKFLEFRSEHEVRVFQCLPEKLIQVALECEGEGVDFTQEGSIEQVLSDPPAEISIYTVEKEYNESREEELFEMIEWGCLVGGESLFKALSLALAASQE
ncbi:hypothetical protein KFE98_19995 [bacterium SCSIO 12741]|nr:hypothetical protein KFE98_19995 [bacterium SCSIO 12741]